jgi:hypothetical protein
LFFEYISLEAWENFVFREKLLTFFSGNPHLVPQIFHETLHQYKAEDKT